MLKEIRRQPSHIRAIFMWLSVFIVFSLVIFIWIQSFQQRLTFLLDPSKELETAKQESPITTIGKGLDDLRAEIFNLFGLAAFKKQEGDVGSNLEERTGVKKIEPRLLPVSE
ncbi:MAG: hypothetical protein G01um10142_35 [Parcubacteria group bacterium Gr01-1014_2]|nr:MAG: hypothetical protein G01um10142_35 [Parcubacteria group bacterium Gr01-1014_2]